MPTPKPTFYAALGTFYRQDADGRNTSASISPGGCSIQTQVIDASRQPLREALAAAHEVTELFAIEFENRVNAARRLLQARATAIPEQGYAWPGYPKYFSRNTGPLQPGQCRNDWYYREDSPFSQLRLNLSGDDHANIMFQDYGQTPKFFGMQVDAHPARRECTKQEFEYGFEQALKRISDAIDPPPRRPESLFEVSWFADADAPSFTFRYYTLAEAFQVVSHQRTQAWVGIYELHPQKGTLQILDYSRAGVANKQAGWSNNPIPWVADLLAKWPNPIPQPR